ncbi:MAG: hypothetical protein R2941_21290 [Desulfobacterales bacterium]
MRFLYSYEDNSDQFFSLTLTLPENNVNNVAPDSDQDGIPDDADTDDDNDGLCPMNPMPFP